MIKRKVELRDLRRSSHIDRKLIILESPKWFLLERSGKVLSMQVLTQISCVEAVKFIIPWKSSHGEAEMDFLNRFQANNLLIFFTQTEFSPCVLQL